MKQPLNVQYSVLLLLLFYCFTCTALAAPKLRNKPKVGDYCVEYNNKVRFICPSDYNKEQLSNITSIGVVFNIKGRIAKIVAGEKSEPVKWAQVTLWQVTNLSVPEEAGIIPIYFLSANKNQGFIDYIRQTGTITEFIDQINDWFRRHELIEWSAYMQGGLGYIQYSGIIDDHTGYDFKVGNCVLDRATLSYAGLKQVDGYCRNKVMQKHWICGMNRERMEDYCKNGEGDDFQVSKNDVIDAKHKLFSIVPLAKDSYLQSGELTKSYKTYAKYMDACMVNIEDKEGVMKRRDGKQYTQILAKTRIPVVNGELSAFPAAKVANDYHIDNSVKFGKGRWWLPTMYDLALLMRSINKVNASLSMIPQWETIRTDAYYWSCCPCSSYYVWFYHCDGMSDANNMVGSDENGNLFIRSLFITEVKF